MLQRAFSCGDTQIFPTPKNSPPQWQKHFLDEPSTQACLLFINHIKALHHLKKTHGKFTQGIFRELNFPLESKGSKAAT